MRRPSGPVARCVRCCRPRTPTGSVQTGRFADLVAVAGNPLTDIGEMRRITFVMKGGVVYKGAGQK